MTARFPSRKGLGDYGQPLAGYGQPLGDYGQSLGDYGQSLSATIVKNA